MKKLWKYLVGVVLVVLLVTAYSAGTKATEVTSSSPKYIEVCSHGTAYLPPGTKFVTCRGKIMEVIDVVPLADDVQILGNCSCPQCCNGFCSVIVRCGTAPEPSPEANMSLSEKTSSGSGGLCVAWLACD